MSQLTPELQTLIDDMVETMRAAPGVGLAAPQVGVPLRVIVIEYGDDEDESVPLKLFTLANPEIVRASDTIELGTEGCLSIPGLRGLVPRHDRIKLKARTVEGEPISLTADSFHARVLQHEFDHLDGIVFLDRMGSPRSLAFEPEWERYVLDGGRDDG